MTDVIVLDEADRMIADGHFKELREILAHVYTQRLKIKTKKPKEEIEEVLPKEDAMTNDNFRVAKGLEGQDEKIDWSQVKDLYDEDEMMHDIQKEGMLDDNLKPDPVEKKRNKKLRQKQIEALEDEKFTKDYTKAGGIQHIICSATLTIDDKGRVTPRGLEKEKRLNIKAKEKGEKREVVSTVDQLCKLLKFRSRNPKIIDLTEDERMPDTLSEFAIRCSREEKDLYMYYYLQQHKGESAIVFCNSITCTKRVSSMLEFLKLRNQCLHSKMQQRQRLKSLDRFRSGV